MRFTRWLLHLHNRCTNATSAEMRTLWRFRFCTSKEPARFLESLVAESANLLRLKPSLRLVHVVILCERSFGDSQRPVCLLWGSTALRALLRDGARSTALLGVTTIFLIFCVGTLVGMFRSMSKIYRYNHEVFPKLESEWSQSFVCRRCGKLQLIS